VVAECAVLGILLAPAIQAKLAVTAVVMRAAVGALAVEVTADLAVVAIIIAAAFPANALDANLPVAAILVLAALVVADAIAAVAALAVIIFATLGAGAALRLVVVAAQEIVAATAVKLLTTGADPVGLTPGTRSAAASFPMWNADGISGIGIVVAAGFVLFALGVASPIATVFVVAVLTGAALLIRAAFPGTSLGRLRTGGGLIHRDDAVAADLALLARVLAPAPLVAVAAIAIEVVAIPGTKALGTRRPVFIGTFGL
jgi:hypothetical protein